MPGPVLGAEDTVTKADPTPTSLGSQFSGEDRCVARLLQNDQGGDGDTQAAAEPVGGTGPIPSKGPSERLPEEEEVGAKV